MRLDKSKLFRIPFVAIAASIVVALPASARIEKVLYSFCQTTGCPDGQDPYSPMVQDAHGNLFGTTLAGGNASNAGTIYELQKVKRSWVFHSLYSFCSQTNCTDGSTPYGGLIVDVSGNLYGTTLLGGNANDGAVYELQKNGTFKVLYSFCALSSCADGAQPYAGLTYQGQQTGAFYDGSSPLYGTTSSGGVSNLQSGVVYTITPGGVESVLYAFGEGFNNFNDGVKPLAPLTMDSDDNLYGTTNNGGSTNSGTIFGVSPSGS
jgi:uncharacterized repeat protein (TIGR03803 family)